MQETPRPARLRVADLSDTARAWLLAQRYDRFVEKHEGPFGWDWLIEPEPYEVPDREAVGKRRSVLPPAAEFLSLDGRDVLLPEGEDHHPNVRLLRTVVGDDGRCLTLFLTDTTHDTGSGAGRFAFCERAPDGEWYVCRVWHEWYVPREMAPASVRAP